MPPDAPAKSEQIEREIERLSEELKEQVQMAKDRLSDRYAKLMEQRTFDGDEDKQEA
jgi:hypothetical protein